MIPLTELKQGEISIITNINCEDQCCQRLCDMGLTRGTEIKIVRCAPLGGPVIVYVRGTNLVLEAGMANKIYVETIEDSMEY